MKEICIYGAGGLGKEIYGLIAAINAVKEEWQVVGFYDDAYPRKELCMGLPVVGDLNDLKSAPKAEYLVMAIGNPVIRRKVIRALDGLDLKYPVLKHPTATLDLPDTIEIGEGTVVAAGVRMTAEIEIGKHVLVNLNSTIGHNASIADYCALMPSVNIAGNVHLSDAVFVGAGASVINGLIVGPETTVGAGAVIVRDVPGGITVAGVPAKQIIK